MIHALTIDVEEYFHVHAYAQVIDRSRWNEYPSRVEESTRRLLDLLGERGVRATFFVLGVVAERHPALLRAIVAGGHELASHGYAHQRVDALSAEEFRTDIRRAKAILEAGSGVAVTAYRAPSFSITPATPWAYDVLVEEGHGVDSSQAAGRGQRSTAPVKCAPYVIPTRAGPLVEFPLPTTRLMGRQLPVGGGGYLRTFPYWLTRRALRKQAGPFCVYLHPWEIDPGQPRLTAPWRQVLRHRVGIGAMERKLQSLLADFQFATVGQVLGSSGAAPATTSARVA